MKFEVKIRKSWGNFNPTTRIHGSGKQSRKPKFDKARRNDWKRQVDY